MPDREWFLRNVEMIPISGCWIWMGNLMSEGYGRIGVKKTRIRAHRLSYTLFRGEIPDGCGVLHHCDVRCCVNPAHLYAGTGADNTADMIRRGRARFYGAHNPNTKLSVENVAVIRSLLNAGLTGAAIGDLFGVRDSAIYKIKHGRNWRHI